MTLYGWDTSRFDGPLSPATLLDARAAGITVWSHKIGEYGLADPRAAAAFAAARPIFPVISGYWFMHGQGSPATAAEQCVHIADQVAPYWRDFPAWFWTADAERSSTGLPSPAYVSGFCDELAAATGKTVIAYASAGMYGDRLAGLGHPLWNAHYGSNPVGLPQRVYPGDDSAGWEPYSGQTPVLLQFTSRAIIAGLTTCDADAFRGTLEDLYALIGADAMTPADLEAIGEVVDAKVRAALADPVVLTDIAVNVWGVDPGTIGPDGVVHLNGGLATPPWRPDAPAQGGNNPTATPGWFVRMMLDAANGMPTPKAPGA